MVRRHLRKQRRRVVKQKGGFIGAILKAASTVSRFLPRIGKASMRYGMRTTRRHGPRLIRKGIDKGIKKGTEYLMERALNSRGRYVM